MSRKCLYLLEIGELELGGVGHSVPPAWAWDSLSQVGVTLVPWEFVTGVNLRRGTWREMRVLRPHRS